MNTFDLAARIVDMTDWNLDIPEAFALAERLRPILEKHGVIACESPANPPQVTAAEFPFVAIKLAIMRGSERVAVAVSHTMARRIANALNLYQPNHRGY